MTGPSDRHHGPAAQAEHDQHRARTRDLRARYRRWLRANRHRGDDTIAGYDYILSDWFDHIGHQPEAATEDDLRAFVDRPAGRNARTPQRAEMTKRNNEVAILAWHRWAHGRGLIDVDPLADVIARTVDLGPPRAVTDAQFAALAGSLAGSLRDLAMVWLGYGCLLRAGGVAALRIEWLNLHGEQPEIRVIEKGRRWRVVPVPEAAAEVLRRYLATERRRNGPLFENELRPGRHVSANWITRKMSRACTDAGMPDVTFHWLRHAGAQRHRRTSSPEFPNGVPIDVISRMLGHASVRTTERYLRGWDPNLHAAARSFGDPTRPPDGRPADNRPRGRASQPAIPAHNHPDPYPMTT